MTKIEWAQKTWNPVTGCTKISEGCKNCYAERMARRLRAMGLQKYRDGFSVTLHPGELEKPLQWKKPKMIFVCSMGDLFHDDVPDDFIIEVFSVMSKASQHTFQVLTKRARRMALLSPHLVWTKNIWAGVTVENYFSIERKEYLLITGAHIKFLSVEPMISAIEGFAFHGVSLEGIDWVIVGGETGPGARPMDIDWVRNMRDKCVSSGVPFFFKRLGGVRKTENDRFLDGREWNQYPAVPGKEV